ncbi:MAG TPA: XrtA system polysaccharide chain length determinant [Alphaproteobacteria bacterium]
MNETYEQILASIKSVWHRRWYVAAIAWLVCGAGWTLVASLPDKYESQARIYIDMDTMLGPLMRGLAVEMNVFQQIDLMQRTLFSRPNLEKIALLTDLDLQVSTPEQKDALLEGLKKKLAIAQQGRNLFQITYEDFDRQLTKRVVQAVLQIFVEGNLGASRKDMDTTRRFLQDQIADYEKQLVAAEERLAEFKRQNMGMMPGEHSYYDTLVRATDDHQRTQAFVDEAVKVRDSLKQQLAEIPEFFTSPKEDARTMAMVGGGLAGPESDLSLRILDMERTIDGLLLRYTENHPDVVVLRKRVAEMKAQLEKETQERLAHVSENPTPNGAGDAKFPNPLYEQIKLQLVKQEAVIAALQRRTAAKKQDMDKLAGLAKTAPQIEAELQRLNRDYDIIKRGYLELRQRQESAKLARDLETKAQKIQFRIVDPPLVPAKPSGPNRPLFLSVVLAAGVASGSVFAFLLGQLNKTFPSAQSLRHAFTYPVIGGVTAISSPADRWRRMRELVSFGLVCLGLFAAYGGLVAVELLTKL